MAPSSERVEIPLAGGGSMGGYQARPDGPGPHPGVLVFMEIFGVNAHIRDVTDRVGATTSIASFAEDARGELYLMGLGGSLYRIVPDPAR